MTRKEFFIRTGIAALSLPLCTGLLTQCSTTDPTPSAPANVDFTIDVSTGALAQDGGYLTKNGVIIAKTQAGDFLAVSAVCTHQGTNVQYEASQNDFYCPNHGAKFSATGKVINGPATRSLAQYRTALTGTSLRVFS